MGTLGSPKPSVQASPREGACSWGLPLADLIPPPRATPSPCPSPGRLAMIVTEYMENGSLDAFLRVRAHPAFHMGPAEGSSFWVLGEM